MMQTNINTDKYSAKELKNLEIAVSYYKEDLRLKKII